jgi:hypothetical protein
MCGGGELLGFTYKVTGRPIADLDWQAPAPKRRAARLDVQHPCSAVWRIIARRASIDLARASSTALRNRFYSETWRGCIRFNALAVWA